MRKPYGFQAFKGLACAVLTQALNDLTTGNYQYRATARTFFKSGRFRMWADVADFSHDVLIKAYKEKLGI